MLKLKEILNLSDMDNCIAQSKRMQTNKLLKWKRRANTTLSRKYSHLNTDSFVEKVALRF